MLCEHGSRNVDTVLNHMPDELNAAPQQGSRLMGLADCRKTSSSGAHCVWVPGEGSGMPLDLRVVNSRLQLTFEGFGLRFLFEGRTVVDSPSKSDQGSRTGFSASRQVSWGLSCLLESRDDRF